MDHLGNRCARMNIRKDRSIFLWYRGDPERYVPVETVERVESVVVTLNSTQNPTDRSFRSETDMVLWSRMRWSLSAERCSARVLARWSQSLDGLPPRLSSPSVGGADPARYGTHDVVPLRDHSPAPGVGLRESFR